MGKYIYFNYFYIASPGTGGGGGGGPFIRWHGSHGLHASYAYALFPYFYEGKKKNMRNSALQYWFLGCFSTSPSLGLKVIVEVLFM